jgi:hypothetical protein
MSKHLVAHPEFIKAFVSECFSNGFNEKQASDLLGAYAKAEFYTTDHEYRAGFESTIKEANVPKATWGLIKALAQSAKGKPGLTMPIGLGAAAGAFAPEGILPDNYEGGALSGAALGALLGAIGTRGRGLGSSLNRIGKAVSKGGLGRTLAGEAGKLVINPTVLKGTGRGILGGLAAAGTSKLMDSGLGGLVPGRKPGIDPNTGIPWYMNQDGTQNVQTATSVGTDPFELPSDIMARVRGEGAGVASSASSAGPMNSLANKKNQLVELDNAIASMQNSLPSGSNPTSFGQRQSMQFEIDKLKMQRNQLAQSVGALENQINTDKANMFNLSAERQRAAEQGLASTRNEFDMLRRRQQFAEQGGFLGGLMGLYNRMSGASNRLQQLDPMYSSYMQQLEQARKMQELAQ